MALIITPATGVINNISKSTGTAFTSTGKRNVPCPRDGYTTLLIHTVLSTLSSKEKGIKLTVSHGDFNTATTSDTSFYLMSTADAISKYFLLQLESAKYAKIADTTTKAEAIGDTYIALAKLCVITSLGTASSDSSVTTKIVAYNHDIALP